MGRCCGLRGRSSIDTKPPRAQKSRQSSLFGHARSFPTRLLNGPVLCGPAVRSWPNTIVVVAMLLGVLINAAFLKWLVVWLHWRLVDAQHHPIHAQPIVNAPQPSIGL